MQRKCYTFSEAFWPIWWPLQWPLWKWDSHQKCMEGIVDANVWLSVWLCTNGWTLRVKVWMDLSYSITRIMAIPWKSNHDLLMLVFKPLLFPKLRLCNLHFFPKGGTVFEGVIDFPGMYKKIGVAQTEPLRFPPALRTSSTTVSSASVMGAWRMGLGRTSCSKIYFTLVSLRQMLYMWRKLKKKRVEEKCGHWKRDDKLVLGCVTLGAHQCNDKSEALMLVLCHLSQRQEPLQKVATGHRIGDDSEWLVTFEVWENSTRIWF